MTIYTATIARKIGNIPTPNAALLTSFSPANSINYMTITPAGSTNTLRVPYAPRETTHSNLSYAWDEVARSGNSPLLVHSGSPQPHMSFTLQLGNPNPDISVLPILNQLKAFARQESKLQVVYTGWENGYWRILTMSVDVKQRHYITHEPTQATVDIEMIMEPNSSSNNGPASGGKSSGVMPRDPQGLFGYPVVKKYTVKKGDTLHKLAVHFYKDASQWKKIAKDNKISNPKAKSALKVGKVLKLTGVK